MLSQKLGKLCAGVAIGLCRNGDLTGAVDSYVELCHSTPTQAPEEQPKAKTKIRTRFPNLAGFCRYLGTGLGDISRLAAEYPLEYDKLIAIFEDEALNSEVSPTLLSAYLKKRMRYTASEEASEGGKEVSYCFEHDIFADGQ